MVLISLSVLVLASVALIWLTKLFSSEFEEIVDGLSWKRFAFTRVLVALSTSLPELVIALMAIVRGVPQLAIGTALGSNIVDVSLIIGLTTLFGGGLAVVGNYYLWEYGVVFIIGMAPLALLIDGRLSRIDGLILLVIYVIYIREFFLNKRVVALVDRSRTKKKFDLGRVLVRFAAVTFLLLASAYLLVENAMNLADRLNIPVLIISLVLIAFGTGVPELALEIEAIKRKKPALALSNILGSIVTNATLIVGLTALISPLNSIGVHEIGFINVGFVLTFSLFWLFSKTKRKLSRQEGLVLIGLYLMFLGLAWLF